MKLALPGNFKAKDAPRVLDQARPILDLPPDAKLCVENVTTNARGTRIDFSYTQSVALDDDDLREVAGIRVDVNAHGDLKFNAQGNLVSYDVEPADPRQLRAIGDHVSKLVANGQVYVAKRGEQVDPERLRQQGKAWYVEEDAQGNKRLKRAWIS
ncbi:MAG: hypothetical protein EYC68_10625 [Chloroflexota bacterium]|nr:MAG: hypothetical protein EYC68_10625 [Chloroflexota bacterium]